MLLPDQLVQTGGSFQCTACGTVNAVAAFVAAAQVPMPHMIAAPPKPKPTSDPRRTALLVAITALCILGVIAPWPAVLIGVGLAGWAIAAVAGKAPSVLGLLYTESTRRNALAIGSLCIGLFVATCGLVGVSVEREREADKERAEQSVREAKAEAAAALEEAKAQADTLIDEAASLLAAGDVERARAKLTEARDLDETNEHLRPAIEELKRVSHEQDLASMPGRLEKIKKASESEEWHMARKACKAAAAIDDTYAGLVDLCKPVAAEVEALRRTQAVDQALAVAADKEKCDTPLEIQQAWEALKSIPEDDPNRKKASRAAKKLEKCRKKVERQFDKGLRDVMVMQRTNFATQLENSLLDDGLDVRVTAKGKYSDHLKVKWILMGRPAVRAMTKETGFLQNAEKVGFKLVTFTDGYYESFKFDLAPESEAGGGKGALEGMGLDQPLSL
ncbi:MAG: hypothetical protein JKY37_32735 [Nannocystaceae bacterium]|nr:hypothetical protein [Nannocystaceae bacterium]